MVSAKGNGLRLEFGGGLRCPVVEYYRNPHLTLLANDLLGWPDPPSDVERLD